MDTAVAGGHSLDSILHARQPGLPYGGWTRPQLFFFSDLCGARKREERGEFIAGLMLGISGALDKKANEKVRKMIEEMQRG